MRKITCTNLIKGLRAREENQINWCLEIPLKVKKEATENSKKVRFGVDCLLLYGLVILSSLHPFYSTSKNKIWT
jgi:hypothetical protein